MPWMVRAAGNQLGPFSDKDMLSWVQAGGLRPGDLVWRSDMQDWIAATEVPEFAEYVSGRGKSPASLGDDPGMRLLLPVGRSPWAIAAGYLGLFSFLVLPGPLALLTGLVAVLDIRRNPKRHGMGRAIFGLAMGALATIALAIILIEKGS